MGRRPVGGISGVREWCGRRIGILFWNLGFLCRWRCFLKLAVIGNGGLKRLPRLSGSIRLFIPVRVLLGLRLLLIMGRLSLLSIGVLCRITGGFWGFRMGCRFCLRLIWSCIGLLLIGIRRWMCWLG